MVIDKNFSLLETNQCPSCMGTFLKHGVGSDKYIHCNSCGYDTDIFVYRRIMKEFLSKKFSLIEPDEPEEELI